MSKQYRFTELMIWFSIPLGLLMTLSTYKSFGWAVAAVLGIVAAVLFYILVRRERRKLAYTECGKNIEKAIREVGDYQNVVEISRIRFTGGMLARVYLIDAGEKAGEIYNSVAGYIKKSIPSGIHVILQFTSVRKPGEVEIARKKLDKALVRKLRDTGK